MAEGDKSEVAHRPYDTPFRRLPGQLEVGIREAERYEVDCHPERKSSPKVRPPTDFKLPKKPRQAHCTLKEERDVMAMAL